MYLTKDDIVEVLHQMKDFENELNNTFENEDTILEKTQAGEMPYFL